MVSAGAKGVGWGQLEKKGGCTYVPVSFSNRADKKRTSLKPPKLPDLAAATPSSSQQSIPLKQHLKHHSSIPTRFPRSRHRSFAPILISKMSSSQSSHARQDFIARIRYSNALPPPPNPPKLLDIPNTGLASGQYTTPGFASRLAREQPLNIEADAELGMPLDLVGMPGVFDGDESCKSDPSQSSSLKACELTFSSNPSTFPAPTSPPA